MQACPSACPVSPFGAMIWVLCKSHSGGLVLPLDPFGFLTSHTRAHGAPPTEPWLYDSKRVQDVFRKSAEMEVPSDALCVCSG